MLGGIVAGLLYENVFAVNASIAKAKGYLLGTAYDPDSYQPVEKDENLKVTEAEASI